MGLVWRKSPAIPGEAPCGARQPLEPVDALEEREKQPSGRRRILGNLLFYGVLAVCLMVVCLSFFSGRDGLSIGGMQFTVVLSGSMAPAFDAGSLLVIKETPPGDIRAGDVLCYGTGDATVTHRVVDIYEEDGRRLFITRGDANNTADAAPVAEGQIRGVATGWVPHLGFLLLWLKNPSALLSIVLAGLSVIVFRQALSLPGETRVILKTNKLHKGVINCQ